MRNSTALENGALGGVESQKSAICAGNPQNIPLAAIIGQSGQLEQMIGQAIDIVHRPRVNRLAGCDQS